MAKTSAGAVNPYGRTGVRIVVAGDRGTGKSSLIVTAAAENFPANVPPVLPPTRLPEDFYPDRVPVTIIDTSSRYVYMLSNFCSVYSSFAWLLRKCRKRRGESEVLLSLCREKNGGVACLVICVWLLRKCRKRMERVDFIVPTRFNYFK